MSATLKQAGKLLSIFQDIPTDRLQAIFESGVLTDIRDTDMSQINRNLIRGALKKPLLFDVDKAEDGWELVENVPRTVENIESLDVVRCIEDYQTQGVKLETIREKSLGLGSCMGQEDAEWLLRSQELLPSSWRKHRIYFPGTAWRGFGNELCVPHLHTVGGPWLLGFLRVSATIHGSSHHFLVSRA